MSPKVTPKTMKKLLEANAAYGQRSVSQVFSDFCELSALSIRNRVDLNGHADREQRYLRITGGYNQEEEHRFGEMLGLLVNELSGDLTDVLGQLYMSLDFGRTEMGQFFTPYGISQLMARMTSGEPLAKLQTQEFITLSEPTCGSGGMIVAFAEVMRQDGYNYQQQLHVTAQDLERTAVHMTYIALSLLHIPAVVIHGNTLTTEVRDCWYTPAHILGGWSAKLRARTEQETQATQDDRAVAA